MIIAQVAVLSDHPHQTNRNCFSCLFKVSIPRLPHAGIKALLDHVFVRKLAGLVPHGRGELPPGLALTASLCLSPVVSVGSATGPTAFPAEVVEACVGGRLVAPCALPFLTSAHGKTGLTNVQAGQEPKWLRLFCELVNEKSSESAWEQ